jgi:6-phosphofructokinase 1
LGGDDTLKTANYVLRMQDVVDGLRKVRVIHLPKTIDNDYNGIDWTFGFMSAAQFAGEEIRNIGSDAKSTDAWWIIEVMGRKAGWLTYAAGIAGEATKMISVEDCGEIFDLDVAAAEIADLVEARVKDGRPYGVVCVAEGLAEKLPDHQRPRDRDEHGNMVLASAQIGKMLMAAVEKTCTERGYKPAVMRNKQIGYECRCTPPTAFDVMLGSQLGVGACRALLDEGLNGVMVSVEGQLKLTYVPFSDLIDPETLLTVVRFIQCDSDFYRLARSLEYQVCPTPEPEC